jgi:raffinose/stachyose/melibiose transport system permease protein
MEKAIKKYWPFFVIPTFGAFVIGFIIPFCQGLYLSFCKFTTVGNAEWVGLDNYKWIFTKEVTGFAAPGAFKDAFWFTTKFAVVSIILINVLAFALALALTKGIKGTNIFRTVFFMPNLIGGVVLGYIWKTLINCVLNIVGEPLLDLNSTAGYWGLIILMCWQQVGYMMIIYIAGLQSVPDSVMEASKIDGANSWQTLIKIKLPMVMSSVTICVFLTLTNSFKLFDQNMALTNGKPFKNPTEMLALNIYNTFYARSGKVWMGRGQAKAVIFTIVVVVLALAQLSATRSKEVQQ